MPDADAFRLASEPEVARRAAAALFRTVVTELASVLPPSAEILHVGATAIPGCLTKGDLDVVVRVDPTDFMITEMLLAERFRRNLGSSRTIEFAAFEDPARSPHLGIQLTTRGGTFDVFHVFASALRSDPDLVDKYNELKLRCCNQSMEDYRTAKDAFVAHVLAQKRVTLP